MLRNRDQCILATGIDTLGVGILDVQLVGT